MSVRNVEYLGSQLKELGYSDRLIAELPARMEPDHKVIMLNESRKYEFGTLYFSPVLNRAKDDAFYFLNEHQVMFIPVNTSEIIKFKAYVNPSHNFTLDQLAKMARGGSVESEQADKDRNVYIAWSGFDREELDHLGFSRVKSHTYDIHEAVSKFRLPEAEDPAKLTSFIQTLKQGDFAKTSIDGQDLFVAPSLKFQTLNFYDENMEPLSFKRRLELMTSEAKAEIKERIKENREERTRQKNGKSIR
ncbi:hypothetical protein MKQ68_18835 [Chitinophaga horti]|uniref:Uncharacterized protein n=1 Tax=Chitinophaga horti TaxID=2920382 RepID=A0ABY6J1W7_9BACT|nr:hypothetical protein [Chitinophaga horti]UYQ92147.1 hypothetical protein MKQ68_18835 [Chitinophaga horti]